MVDWQDVINSLREMRLYFEGCYHNAWQNSKAMEKFERYMKMLETVISTLEELVAGEDDGK